ncbi:hypothetical protein DMUE_1445 [Dictyocoela muelleri]|nr:hypothetical protein DMUE_1445 [Dictyocoela muelleri]
MVSEKIQFLICIFWLVFTSKNENKDELNGNGIISNKEHNPNITENSLNITENNLNNSEKNNSNSSENYSSNVTEGANYLNYTPPEILEFFEKYVYPNEEELFDIETTMADLIQSFANIIVKGILKKAFDYQLKWKNGKYIRFTSYDKPLNISDFVNKIHRGYISLNTNISYSWLYNICKRKNYIYDINDDFIINNDSKFVLYSQAIPEFDDINFIWNIYNMIKECPEYSDKYIFVTILLNNEKDNNICNNIQSINFTEIFFNFQNDIFPHHFNISGLYAEKLIKNFQYFYKITLNKPTDGDVFNLTLNTPTLRLQLKLKERSEHKKFLDLTVINKIMNKEYKIIFLKMKEGNLKVTVNKKKIKYLPKLEAKIFEYIMKINNNPYLDLNIDELFPHKKFFRAARKIISEKLLSIH